MSEDKALTKVKSLARAYTDKAIEVLGGIMSAPQSSDAARVAAANSLLDRGWGKVPQGHEGTDGPPIKGELEVIKRLVVDPARNPDS